MIKINNIYINKNMVDYFQINRNENTIYIHLHSGTSFIFYINDCKDFIDAFNGGGYRDF